MEKIVQITDDMIIKLWRTGLTVKQITKRYIQSKKKIRWNKVKFNRSTRIRRTNNI